MKKKLSIGIAFIIVISFFLISCSKSEEVSVIMQKEPELIKEEKEGSDLLAWMVYWDAENGKNELLNSKGINKVCYFAAYFNESNQLILPDEIDELKKKINLDKNQNELIEYLTIVNDKVLSNGKSSLKDQNLLEELLKNETTRNQHIDDIISLAKANGYEGLEIDYERIRKNYDLWALFIDFIIELNARCENEGLKLRIVLEPTTPFDKAEFPEGPEYVMMCYNLHGTHNDPGPKADFEFIENLIKDMKTIQGDKNFALATGGFDWSSDGKVTALTEEQAFSLLNESGSNVQRDAGSGSLNYKYSDKSDILHEVWFADDITLNGWIKTIEENGTFGISIWRLGGNVNISTIV
ncbi:MULTISPECIES: glycosyl hydrolase family 18 protein [unclassified Acetobacterium]|uniref:glycosyl hydrolase family 18 protein n=1 Tax=unclassified Acetobacterium TaxID=2638182 RepID=UPI0013A6E8F6|nr:MULTISPECIES: glycosyl hydrolase family 18 protein [unclassified Acetobacterium]MDZ5723861.1 glycosyl hydrolase family 18 protein [Acetobacterium sp. K1/6]